MPSANIDLASLNGVQASRGGESPDHLIAVVVNPLLHDNLGQVVVGGPHVLRNDHLSPPFRQGGAVKLDLLLPLRHLADGVILEDAGETGDQC